MARIRFEPFKKYDGVLREGREFTASKRPKRGSGRVHVMAVDLGVNAENASNSSENSGGPGADAPFVETILNGTFLGRYDGPPGSSNRVYQSAPAVTLEVPVIEQTPGNLELILDASSTLLPFHFLRTGDRLGRAVVKLLRGDGGSGTGFLVAPGILLTNHHVLPDPAAAATAITLANYETAPPGAPMGRPASVPLDPDSLFVTNAELDFTFCAVRGLDFLGSVTLDRNSLNIGPSETVNIIQHPRGRPKEVAIKDNHVIKADSVVIHYACSTEPGSSGSPVFNNQWEPVALHHASVVSDGPEARPVGGSGGGPPAVGTLGEPQTRYLNEGIRISAIALWLETAEANTDLLRGHAARLREIFGGIDPQVGFFGALGRKSYGRTAPEVVVESYRGDTDDLDLAFWNIRGLESTFHNVIAEIGKVIADMGMDLWCLSHVDDICISALREHLDAHFHLDFEFFHEPAGVHPALALLYRRSKALAVERRSWGVDLPEGVELPPLITVRALTRRCGTVSFQLVPVVRALNPNAASAHYAEAVRLAIRRGHGELDWIIVGETTVLLAPDRLHVLADSDRDLLAAASEHDGALALLTTPRSRVGQVFVSPNLRPAFGLPETLTVTQDRNLPPLLTELGGYRPIALRLAFEHEPRPLPDTPSTEPGRSTTLRQGGNTLTPFDLPGSSPPSPSPSDADLERRIRDMLAPILAQLLTDARKPNIEGPG